MIIVKVHGMQTLQVPNDAAVEFYYATSWATGMSESASWVGVCYMGRDLK